MVSLFNMVLMTGEWELVLRPILESQRLMALFFYLMLILCSFGILNVIIGVVVERTTEAMNELRADQLDKLKQMQLMQTEDLAEAVAALDDNRDGKLTREEFRK